MQRPKARQKDPDLKATWRYLIVDGYVDEPASLGVPPYLSPQVRSLAGGLSAGGAKEEEIGYITVDQWRNLRGKGSSLSSLRGLEAAVIITGCMVPGKYLRGDPISTRETQELLKELNGVWTIITGSAAGSDDRYENVNICRGDPGVLGYGISSSSTLIDRDRTSEEWDQHLIEGASMVWMHPDHPSPLIIEIETSRGCPRYISGGCSFCMEPGKGPVQFREPSEVILEVETLADHGVENIRIGGQSDLLTYLSPNIGRDEVPAPDLQKIEELMSGVKEALHRGKGVKRAVSHGRRIGIDTGIVHTDNANPTVIATYPDISRQALRVIMEGSTSGSVLALGLESSDENVRKINNLNSGPNEVMDAVRIMNEVGGEKGPNGLPRLLPGLNFLGGLPGQRPESFHKDMELLEKIYKEGLMVRRINIRGVIFEKGDDHPLSSMMRGSLNKAFVDFRRSVREKMDPLFLGRMLPLGSTLKGILIETALGKVSFGRQIGSYPILVGIEHSVRIGEIIDVAVSEISSRSITAFRTPFQINSMGFRDLQALPGVGKKRAAMIFRKQPVDKDTFIEITDPDNHIMEHMKFN